MPVLFLKLYVLFLGMWLVQAGLAYKHKILYRAQGGQEAESEKGLYWVERPAMISDFFFMTPLAAYALAFHGHEWSALAIKTLGTVVAVVCVGLNIFWAFFQGKHSVRIMNGFGPGGKATSLGCVHFVYMTSCLSSYVLYYLATPRGSVTQLEATVSTILLCTHAVYGTLYQSYLLHGQPSRSDCWLTFQYCFWTCWGHWMLFWGWPLVGPYLKSILLPWMPLHY